MKNLLNLFPRLRFRLWLSSSLRFANFFSKLPILKNRQNKLSQFQIDAFANLGMDYVKARELTNSLCLRTFQSNYDSSNGMWSDHLVYFSGLSLLGYKPKSILEVGTFKGETTRYLSFLFPESLIRTLDISRDEMNLKNIYSYAINSSTDLFTHRKNNIGALENVQFNETNSLSLTFENEEYDLIWLDGAHGYPIANIDFANCLRLLAPNGKLVCDDIYLDIKREDPNYFSLAVFKSLEAFKSANLVDFRLIFKRIDLKFNYWKTQKKFVAIAEKKSNFGSN